MNSYGYGGRILRVNLTERSYKIERLDLSWMLDVIGGRPANSKRLFEELNPDCDPLGPENLLIFGIGPLTGSIMPASAYFTVSAKSPLTGILGDSAAGGQFASEMKLCGFDQIIISGKANQFIYLNINNTGVQFINSSHLKGKNILDTTSCIRLENRNPSLQVAAIGLAGENLVHYASIVSSGNRVNGRTGMGAVMGSKNLKAIALSGTGSVTYAFPDKLMDQVKEIKHAIFNNTEYKKRYHVGTTMLMKDLNEIGILPVNHFQDGICDYVDKISGETLANIYKVKNKACFNCNVHCSRYYMTEQVEAEGPEYEMLCGFTTRIGSSDLSFALEMNYYLNQVGMDALSACEAVGWLMECQEKGLIKPEDVDGFSINFGQTHKVRELLEMIVNRRGIGDELANGATKYSSKFSETAQKLVMQVKGLDIICGDPRGLKAYGLTYAVASRGGDHLRAEPYFELTKQWDLARERFGTAKAADRLAEEGKAALVKYSEKIALLTDALTMCKNVGLCMDVINFNNTCLILEYATGIKYEPKNLEQILDQAVMRDYALNKKFGVKPEDDTLPDRFTKEQLHRGPSKGETVNIRKMVTEYNRIRNR
ncbi:MAG: aldehyde ferredoxin oxidoreductase family protein, partial [Bacteroidales bacterium]|nr:aldehyde ferredoxin oxidoreductase family protein [Bacteroidales bacterium]